MGGKPARLAEYVRKFANEDALAAVLKDDSEMSEDDDGNDSDSTISDYSEGERSRAGRPPPFRLHLRHGGVATVHKDVVVLPAFIRPPIDFESFSRCYCFRALRTLRVASDNKVRSLSQQCKARNSRFDTVSAKDKYLSA